MDGLKACEMRASGRSTFLPLRLLSSYDTGRSQYAELLAFRDGNAPSLVKQGLQQILPQMKNPVNIVGVSKLGESSWMQCVIQGSAAAGA